MLLGDNDGNGGAHDDSDPAHEREPEAVKLTLPAAHDLDKLLHPSLLDVLVEHLVLQEDVHQPDETGEDDDALADTADVICFDYDIDVGGKGEEFLDYGRDAVGGGT